MEGDSTKSSFDPHTFKRIVNIIIAFSVSFDFDLQDDLFSNSALI
jgi:hypothetical protein